MQLTELNSIQLIITGLHVIEYRASGIRLWVVVCSFRLSASWCPKPTVNICQVVGVLAPFACRRCKSCNNFFGIRCEHVRQVSAARFTLPITINVNPMAFLSIFCGAVRRHFNSRSLKTKGISISRRYAIVHNDIFPFDIANATNS